jgi:hypothetical protein
MTNAAIDTMGFAASAFGVAPSNATPWYQTCTARALGSGAASIALDSVAFIPGGKEIEIGAETAARQIGNLKGYRGIVADNYGRAFLTSSGSRLKGAAAGVSLGDSVTSGDGISSTLNVLGLIPGISDISATLSIAYDAGKTAVAVYKCSHP